MPVVTAGGSAYFDDVAEVLGPLLAEGARVVLRSGAYLTHDDGHYRHLSPLGEHPRTSGSGLVSALHGWVRVSSQPEPGLAWSTAASGISRTTWGCPRCSCGDLATGSRRRSRSAV